MAKHEWSWSKRNITEEEIEALENRIKKLEAEVKSLRKQDGTENGEKQILLESVE